MNANAKGLYKKETLMTKEDLKLRVYRPWKINSDKKYPLFISLHGYSGTPFLQNIVMPLSRLVAKKNLLLVTPEGLKDLKENRYWNSLDCCTGSAQNDQKRNDVQFLKSLIKQLSQTYPISKVYVVGHSNGGFMSYQMACEASHLISGIVNYGGAGLKKSDCEPTHPVKILHIHGTDDETIQYSGSDWHLSAPLSVENWAFHNHCHPEPKGRLIQKKSWKTKKIFSQVWNDCENNSKVALWTIKNGKHRDLLSKPLTEKILDYFDL